MKELTISTGKELILLDLTTEREIWLEAKHRDERAGGHSCDAVRDRFNSMEHLNFLLEQLIELDYGK